MGAPCSGAVECIAICGSCGHQCPCPFGPGQSARANLPHAGFPYCEKEKAGNFFAAKIFAGPGDPDIFVKIRNCRKTHDGEKYGQFIVHPVSG
jgi:hypothetical protein